MKLGKEDEISRQHRLYKLKGKNCRYTLKIIKAEEEKDAKPPHQETHPWYCGYNNSSEVNPGTHFSNQKRYPCIGAFQMEQKNRRYDKVTDFRKNEFKLNPSSVKISLFADQLSDSPMDFPDFSMYVCGSKLKDYPPLPDLGKYKKIARSENFQRFENSKRVDIIRRHKAKQIQASNDTPVFTRRCHAATYVKSPFGRRLSHSRSASILEL